MIRSCYRCCCINEPVIFSHCVHKLGHRFHALLKVYSDCDDSVYLREDTTLVILTKLLLWVSRYNFTNLFQLQVLRTVGRSIHNFYRKHSRAKSGYLSTYVTDVHILLMCCVFSEMRSLNSVIIMCQDDWYLVKTSHQVSF